MSALWTVLVFVVWIAFLAVGIWLLIRLFRNTNFISENRGLRIAVKVVLVVFTLFVPVLGVLVLFVIWFTTRSDGAELPDVGEGERETPSTSSAATPPSHRRPPFPPPSAPKDTDGA
jgi:hypothetical protein